MKEIKLIHTSDGHSKYYFMQTHPTSSHHILSSYGRYADGKPYGNVGQAVYGMDEWDKKVREKLRKGYREIGEVEAESDLDSIFRNLDLLEEKFKNKS